jgi:putative transcriptional regulator
MTTVKRNLFEELTEGFDALEADQQQKLTLRRHTAECRSVEPPSSLEKPHSGSGEKGFKSVR